MTEIRTIKKPILLSIFVALFLLFPGCTPAPIYSSTRGEAPIRSKSPQSTPAGSDRSTSEKEEFSRGQVLYGEASFYGPNFHGKLTANGEIFDQNAMTCAHKTLPFGTTLKVTYLANRKSVIVRVNDRGPYKKGRIIDLSVEAARRIGMLEAGTGSVTAEILSLGD